MASRKLRFPWQKSSATSRNKPAKDAIRCNKTKLQDILCSEPNILDKVYEKYLITDREYKKLKSSTKDAEDRVRAIVDKMLYKGEKPCKDFVELLRTNDDINNTLPQLKDIQWDWDDNAHPLNCDVQVDDVVDDPNNASGPAQSEGASIHTEGVPDQSGRDGHDQSGGGLIHSDHGSVHSGGAPVQSELGPVQRMKGNQCKLTVKLPMGYEQMLSHIAEQLDSPEVAALCFLCSDLIQKRYREKIKDAKELFLRLGEKDLLQDHCFLSQLLNTIGRFDLLCKVLETEGRRTDAKTPNLSAYRVKLYQIHKHMTQDDLDTMKRLQELELGRGPLQYCTTALDVMVKMEERGLLCEENVTELEAILQQCNSRLATILHREGTISPQQQRSVKPSGSMDNQPPPPPSPPPLYMAESQHNNPPPPPYLESASHHEQPN